MIYECISRPRRVIHSMIYQACGLEKKEHTFGKQKCVLFGWGAGIRTPEMLESESSALPLGDTPIFNRCSNDLIIISLLFKFVNRFFRKNLLFFFILVLTNEFRCDIILKQL